MEPLTDFSTFYKHRSKFRACLICKEKEAFASRQALADHYHMKHRWGEKKKCDKCNPGKLFESDAAMRHFQSHFPENEFRCKTCDFSTNRLRTMKVHIHTTHADMVKEENLKKELRKYIPLTEDIETSRFCIVNCCMHCSGNEISEASLASHVKIMHQDVYQCHVCDKRFASMPSFRRHLQDHKAISDYQCKFCLTRFKERSGFRSHVQIQHIDQIQSASLDEFVSTIT